MAAIQGTSLSSCREREQINLVAVTYHKICGFGVSGLAQLRNLRINHKKMRICDLQTGTPKIWGYAIEE
jgi:hypothetical protein